MAVVPVTRVIRRPPRMPVWERGDAKEHEDYVSLQAIELF